MFTKMIIPLGGSSTPGYTLPCELPGFGATFLVIYKRTVARVRFKKIAQASRAANKADKTMRSKLPAPVMLTSAG